MTVERAKALGKVIGAIIVFLWILTEPIVTITAANHLFRADWAITFANYLAVYLLLHILRARGRR